MGMCMARVRSPRAVLQAVLEGAVLQDGMQHACVSVPRQCFMMQRGVTQRERFCRAEPCRCSGVERRSTLLLLVLLVLLVRLLVRLLVLLQISS